MQYTRQYLVVISHTGSGSIEIDVNRAGVDLELKSGGG